MKYFIILSVFVGISLIPIVYAAENYIKIPYAEIEPVIDGKFTFESEWNDAKLIKFQSNGHDFYMQTKQDDNFIYLFFDGVDFQADPTDNSTSVRYQALSCFDVNADKADKKQPDDFCLIQTMYNEFGELVKTENAELKYTFDGESLDKSMVHDYEAMWAFGNENDKFEKLNHLSYEFKIPKESVMSKDHFGFNFRMYFGSASDDLVQLSDGVMWPPESDKDKPSTWGTLSMTKQIPSPLKQFNAGARIDKIQCNESLQTILKTDGTPACVKPDSIEKLREYGWTNSKILSDELVREKLLELTGLLESGNVAEFNKLRTELVAFILLERVDASGMNLDGINLKYTSLPGANLHNATLIGANIGNADLSNANLQDSDLKGTDLSYTRLWGANLYGANLQDSNLEGASFRSADLTLANLQNANLENADISITANLSATDLRNVKNIPISIEEARERGAIVD